MKQKFLSGWARISLRAKLTSLSVGLIGMLLAVSSAGTIALLGTYLQQSTDTLLITTANELRTQDPLKLEAMVSSGQLALPSLPSDYYIAILDADGNQFLGLISSTGGGRAIPNFSNLTLETVMATQGAPFDIDVESSRRMGTEWRMVAVPLQLARGSVVIALPTNSNEEILAEYAVIGGRFGIFLVVLSGFSIWLTITSALRPLKEVERTAEAVQAGKFSSRLLSKHGKTEIGRLNNALNSMLDSIEGAVTGRDKTLEQMRRFVSDASHELRTPLVTVRGYAELYRMGAITKKQDVAEAMQRIESEAVRMTGLVESLLTLTRMDESGNLDLVETDLAKLADLVIKDASVANQDVNFRVVRSGRDFVAEVDSDRVKQVLTNLVANASRFAPAGSEVSLEIDAGGKNLSIKVIDHGEGIPEPLRGKVFERFYRADSSRNRSTGGSGLGLAIAQSIVTAHHGEIRAKETPDGGSTFVLELPRKQSSN
ncbi:histidine kinase [Candidatus Aquiluna sp. IMCC13023]|uniref:sensor histidine kinase n=1 Tax=Candidatus Aquiluna sp. IMCC13023 TaxID=1081644 RepID=UPI00025B460A|nr:HAMP domain-containing sensor histidine kinase [Candidatus Aquiluna sp. IMCC13023]EIC92414.1 histidine kinase [Candidatus Aquiluna sp. IMCC13023]